jgi:hypothetical protein
VETVALIPIERRIYLAALRAQRTRSGFEGAGGGEANK